MPQRLTENPTHPPAEIAVPDTIHDLIANSLVPYPEELLPETHGNCTQLFFVDDHPELFVRLNDYMFRDGSRTRDAEAAVEAMHGLQPYGVNVLPARVIESKDEVYIITKRVEGDRLTDLLADNPEEELVTAMDRTWAGLATGLAARREAGESIPRDIATPEQYMVGSISGEDIPRLWLVDFPFFAFDSVYHVGGKTSMDVAEELVSVAQAVVRTQSHTGRKMAAAQRALEKAAHDIGDVAAHGDAAYHAIRYMLEHEVELEIDDPIIESLRIK